MQYRTSFSDEELIDALRRTPERERKRGNLWAFFHNLPRPERERLQAEAQRSKPD